MWRICFKVPDDSTTIDGRRWICINIPLIDPFWKFRRPRPEPWLVLNERPFEFAQDLQILATIANLSQELSPEFGRTLNAGIEQIFSNLKKQLPEGAELNFHEETPAAEYSS